jgi:arginyl-tRNA synthetase
MVFAAAKKIGWVDDESHRLDHIGFGTVQGEDGKRFKTRSGDTVRLVDLLDEAVSRMESSLKERIAEGRANITEDEVHATASAMGYGAVKYFDLRRNPTSNYVSRLGEKNFFMHPLVILITSVTLGHSICLFILAPF